MMIFTLIYRLHASSNYYYSQKSMEDFVLSPPPSGYTPHHHANQVPSQPILSPSYSITNSLNAGPNSGSYSYVKPKSSPLESEISVQSSKYNHFNFHHSPVPERSLNFESTEVSYIAFVSTDSNVVMLFRSIHSRCQHWMILTSPQPCHQTVLRMSRLVAILFCLIVH